MNKQKFSFWELAMIFVALTLIVSVIISVVRWFIFQLDWITIGISAAMAIAFMIFILVSPNSSDDDATSTNS